MSMTPASPDPGLGARGDDLALVVEDLKMHFPVTKGLLRRKVADIKAADGVSFAIGRGETLGLVGGERLWEDHRGTVHHTPV